MKRLSFVLGLAALFLALIVFSSSAYTVSETEQVIITQFGKPVGTPINADPAKPEAGLHFKMPFIQQVNRIEKRILEWDGPATEMPTSDKLYITVDTFARWRITDPLHLFRETPRRTQRAVPPQRHHRQRNPRGHRVARPDRGDPQRQGPQAGA